MAVDQRLAVQQAQPFIRRGDLEIKRAWAYLRALKRAGELPAYGSITIDQLFEEFKEFNYGAETVFEGVEINEWWKNNSDVEGTGTILENVAALRALNSDSFSTNSLAEVLGYWTRGDNGYGAYYLDLADIVTPDNNWSVIVDASGHRWKAIFEQNVIPVERTGFQGVDTALDIGYLQAASDAAPDWSLFAFSSGKEYVLFDRIFIRRNRQFWDGNFCLIKAPDHNIAGGLMQIANCDDAGFINFNIDVNDLPENGMAVTGNNPSAAATAVQPMQYCNRILFQNIRVENATFQINQTEKIRIDRIQTGFQIGEVVTTFSIDGRLSTATITDFETVVIGLDTFYYLVVEYIIGRGSSLGSSVTPKEIRGNTSGTEAFVIDTASNPQVDPYSGNEYGSWHGQFGGKGITVQYGVLSCIINNLQTYNCAIGLSIESKIGVADEGESGEIVCNNLSFRNCSRTGVWIIDASVDDSANIQNCILNNLEVVNWGSLYPYVGALTLDRASNVTVRNFHARIEDDYATPYGNWLIFGICRNCDIQATAELVDVSGIVDLRPHIRWGNGPGAPYAAIYNRFDINVKVTGTTAVTQTYGLPDYTLQTNTVYRNMIAWNPSFNMDGCNFDIRFLGWATADYWATLASVTSRFNLFNFGTGRMASGVMIENPTFDATYRDKHYGNSPNSKLFVGNIKATGDGLFGPNGEVEVGTNGSGDPHIQGITGNLRLTSPTGSTRAQIADPGFLIQSSLFSAATRFGNFRFWFSSLGYPYLKSGSEPANETDGWQIATRWGYATKSASFTYTVGSQQPMQYISGQVANATVTLSSSNANTGDRAVFVRTDTANFTLAIGTLITIPAGVSAAVSVVFDNGTNSWILESVNYRVNAYQILARGTATVLLGTDRIVVNEATATAGRRIFATAATEDLTGGGVKCVLPLTPASGQFTIVLDAATTAAVDVFWEVIN